MTPKDKAEELFNSHKENITYYGQAWKEIDQDAKKHALLSVEEILKAVEGKFDEYWNEVKQELLNLK